MIQFPQNGWFHPSEFMRCAATIHTAATTEHCRHLHHHGTKYLQLYIDQRTGSFLVRRDDGSFMTAEQVYKMFPELEADGPLTNSEK